MRDAERSGAAPVLNRFMGLDLEGAPGVLVPRAQTEILARAAIQRLPRTSTVADVCCGSGNLALAIASTALGATVYAADLTSSAVALARRNVERLGLTQRAHVRQGELFDAFAADGLQGSLEMVVANPPHIFSGRLNGEAAHLLADEPREAVDGGPYGLTIHQRLIARTPAFLKPGGVLAVEFGTGQERQVAILFARARAFEAVEFVNDDAGRPRVAVARLAPAKVGL